MPLRSRSFRCRHSCCHLQPALSLFVKRERERERELGSRGEKGETCAQPPPRLCRREAPLPPLRFTIVTVEEASAAAVDCHWRTAAVSLVAGIMDWREGCCLSYCCCFVLLSYSASPSLSIISVKVLLLPMLAIGFVTAPTFIFLLIRGTWHNGWRRRSALRG
ncbi:uncharacterized protein [Arachis hypogaea]|uniref:uncharacterized protein isoform X3 n=1 Tax=Arachis hypogaea TaxID=3818 RepID=UPI000DEC1414|nr:uncharacterized protein LOC112703301 isoform X3 [Arachis hypogaea]